MEGKLIKGHIFYVNNCSSSHHPSLLIEKQIHLSVTLRVNRKINPRTVIQTKLKESE